MVRYEEVTIKKVYDGKQLVKKGTPDEKEVPKISLMTEEYPEKWISAFVNQSNAGWLDMLKGLNEGDKVKIGIKENGDFLNLVPVDTERELLDDLERRVDHIEKHLKLGKHAPVDEMEYPEEEINPEDIPF